MKKNVYLPNDLAAVVDERGISLSRLTQRAVHAELARLDAIADTTSTAQTYELNFGGFVGRIEGVEIADSDMAPSDSLLAKAEKLEARRKHVRVYLLNDGRVLVYFVEERGYQDATEDPQQVLRPLLPNDAYVKAMNALGITPTIDL